MNPGNAPVISASIRFITGPLAGQTFSITRPITLLGRDATNDIVIKGDQKVSRQHARILWSAGTWSIEDLVQKNTLFVNQKTVQRAIIYNTTTVGLGEDTSFVFLTQADIPTPQRVAPPYPTPPPPPPQQAFPAPQQTFPVSPPQAFAASEQHVFFAAHGYSGPITGISGPTQRPDETVIAQLDQIGIPSLELSSNAHGDRRSYPLNKSTINIGREATNDIIINDRIVSGLHLRIVRQGNQFVIIHPNPDNTRQRTVNGLLYQGRKIRGDEQFSKILTNGDIFRIGDENGTLLTLVYNDGTGTEQPLLPPMQPIRLGDPELIIGRKPENKICLAHPQVSAFHARLVREKGTYRILDLNSTNHVYVNSELTTNHLLKLGDEIRIGPYKLVYEANQLAQYNESNFIRIDALNLKKTGNNNVTLLNNLSFSIPPRKFVALVGGSGAGKSTLMDALNGLRPAHEGKVLYNGQDYYRNLAAFNSQLGYVPQDDIVHRDLPVERALYYAAKLRLPSDFTEEQIQQRINEVLEDVEMTTRRKLLVKKLSGGQRKRVSIALELLANPSLFFLDEPTSGLDPGLDRKMMYLLRKLADKGHTIVLVTHATNNINTCDYVCFLAQGGHLAYFGPPDQAKAYFGKTDFAEIYSSLEPTEENRNIPEEADARFKTSKEYQEYVARPLSSVGITNGHRPTRESKSLKRGNPFSQFLLLAQRNLELIKNDKANLIILLLQAPIIALVLMLLIRFEVGGGIFDPNNVIKCAPQIFSSAAVSSTNPTGTLGINNNGKKDPVSCNTILNYLKTNADGISNPNGTTNTDGTAFASKKGGVNQALQDFIIPGNVNAQLALFIIAFVAVLFGCINGAREIVKESSIYRRERTVNLGIVPYILAKMLVLILFALFQSAALLLIVNAFEPFHQGVVPPLPILLEIYITILLSAIAGLMVGLTVSAFAANEDSANSLQPFILIPQVIFAGVLIPLKDGFLQSLGLLFPTHWSMAALGSSIGLHADKIGGDRLLGNDYTYHGTLFSTFTQADALNRVLLSWAALGGIILALVFVIGIALKRKDIRT